MTCLKNKFSENAHEVDPDLALVGIKSNDELITALLPPMDTPPVNRNFIFNNKMPKCGGTSLKYILYVLSEDNKFHLEYQAPCITECGDEEDGTDGRVELTNHIKKIKTEKPGNVFLLKHHHWLNFTEWGMENPTYINVVRDPVSRFASMYYFQRFGFADMGTDERLGAVRHSWKGTLEDQDQTLDECVNSESQECTDANQVMVVYFCGVKGRQEGPDNCKVKIPGEKTRWGHPTDWEKTAKAAEMAKIHIIKTYYAIGILGKLQLLIYS